MPLYRGYSIETEILGGCCRVGIHPTTPDLPILRQHWFFVRSIAENYPLNEAKRRIDQILKT